MALGLMPSHSTDHLTAACLEGCSSWARQCPCICAQFRHVTLVSASKVSLAASSYGPLSAPSLSLVTHTRFMIHRKYSEKADNNPTIKISTKKNQPLLGVILHFPNPLRQGLTVLSRLVLNSQSAYLRSQVLGLQVCAMMPHESPRSLKVSLVALPALSLVPQDCLLPVSKALPFTGTISTPASAFKMSVIHRCHGQDPKEDISAE